jgi:hypothetical protein
MFTEANTVEQMILDAVAKLGDKPASRIRENAPSYRGESLGDELHPGGEKTLPFGHNGEHVPVHLVDVVQPANNRLTVTKWTS